MVEVAVLVGEVVDGPVRDPHAAAVTREERGSIAVVRSRVLLGVEARRLREIEVHRQALVRPGGGAARRGTRCDDEATERPREVGNVRCAAAVHDHARVERVVPWLAHPLGADARSGPAREQHGALVARALGRRHLRDPAQDRGGIAPRVDIHVTRRVLARRNEERALAGSHDSEREAVDGRDPDGRLAGGSRMHDHGNRRGLAAAREVERRGADGHRLDLVVDDLRDAWIAGAEHDGVLADRLHQGPVEQVRTRVARDGPTLADDEIHLTRERLHVDRGAAPRDHGGVVRERDLRVRLHVRVQLEAPGLLRRDRDRLDAVRWMPELHAHLLRLVDPRRVPAEVVVAERRAIGRAERRRERGRFADGNEERRAREVGHLDGRRGSPHRALRRLAARSSTDGDDDRKTPCPDPHERPTYPTAPRNGCARARAATP